MVKELYQTILRETSLNVTSGEIDSIRKKSITKSGCRVYDGSYLGVSGVLGEPTPEAWTQAEANLSRRIPCPWPGDGQTPDLSPGHSHGCRSIPPAGGGAAENTASGLSPVHLQQ